MSASSTETHRDLRAQRLDVAGTREFTRPGAGEARRAAIRAVTEEWLAELFADAVGRRSGVALAAVGSLGRADSGPLSDLDLVLLHDGRTTSAEQVAAMADRIWYPVWDAGLKLDHSVRTAGECRRVAADDLAAAMGLLDLSLIAGDRDLVAGIRSSVSHDWRAGARKRLPILLEGLSARHHRHGELSQDVEPNLKEAHGGLRDVTVLAALTEAWLTDRPHGRVEQAASTLLDVRDALHVVTGRGRDRLLRDDHDAVAALLGHTDSDDLLTQVSTASRTIAWALDSTVRRASQSQRARTLRVGPRRPQLSPLGYGLFAHDGEAVLGSTQQVGQDAMLPLRAAVVAARSRLPLSPQTLNNLALSPDLPTPWPEAARTLFADLLASGPGLLAVWEGLDQVGIIERWLPEWAAVRSRPQRSAIHRHTVDRHLLEVVLGAVGLSREVARPDLLLVAALLHDIGKVSGAHDHSETGAKISDVLLRRVGYDDADREQVVLLVREHLTLMETATRRDLADPATLQHIIDTVGRDLETFELLRALTIADAKAAGPKAWTEWRAALLDTLSSGIREILGGTAPALPPPSDPQLDPEALAEVASGSPFVTVAAATGGWSVTVHDEDRIGLFADTAGLLAAYGLTVRRARLATVDGVAVDEWLVESPGGDAPEPARIVSGLRRLATGDRSALGSLERRRRQRAGVPSLAGASRAFVVPGSGTEASVLEVRTQDRPGLLHDLGIAFARLGVSVRSAHISTHAGQTLDTFYVTEVGGKMLSPAKVAQALSTLIDACDGEPHP
ncbi:[protein-PII] uridylyltransferase [Janibacter sp. GXQ6167]|uniref:[protein-PII] uridylyltransferase n=1 Tax=Janibacter sp. GXQ6167 TaxID=3240791 RepID=UPI003525B91A